MKPEDLVVGQAYQYTNKHLDQMFCDGTFFKELVLREDVAKKVWFFDSYRKEQNTFIFTFPPPHAYFTVDFTLEELNNLEEKR